MSEIKQTRLRWIKASSPEDLEAAVTALQYKIEIKSIQKDKSGWIVWFVLPENDGIKFQSTEL